MSFASVLADEGGSAQNVRSIVSGRPACNRQPLPHAATWDLLQRPLAQSRTQVAQAAPVPAQQHRCCCASRLPVSLTLPPQPSRPCLLPLLGAPLKVHRPASDWDT